MNDGDGKLVEFPIPVGAPDMRVAYTRRTITELLARSGSVAELQKMSMINPQPVNIAPIILESLCVTMRGVALILDEFLVSDGHTRELKFAPKDDAISPMIETPATDGA